MAAKLTMTNSVGEQYSMQFNVVRHSGNTVDIIKHGQIVATIDENGKFEVWENPNHKMDGETFVHLGDNAQEYFDTLKAMHDLQEIAVSQGGRARQNRLSMFR